MAKNIFHDIIPKEKRSIRNIAIPTSKEVPEKAHTHTAHKITLKRESEEDVSEPSEIKRAQHKPKVGPIPYQEPVALENRVQRNVAPKARIWFLAVCAVLILGGAVAFLISKAEADITLKKFDIELNNNIVANKVGETLLPYSTISLSDESSIEVPAGEQKEVSTTASGKIVMYNNQATSQKLIATTRLETPSGLIFRLENAITIPARKVVEGKVVPGSVEASIRADKPGTKYNVGLNDFNVVAFKDDPRYNNIYGRSKSSIGGGNLGKVSVLGKEEELQAKKQIEEALVKKILVAAEAQVPENFILLPGAYEIDFSMLPEETVGDNVKLTEKAVFKGYIFDKAKLASYLGSLKKLSIKSDSPLSIDPKELKITSIEENGNVLTLHMEGKLHVEYTLDVESLKKDLRGKSRAEALKVLEGYSSIEKAKIVTFPLWKVPDNSAKITVNLH